MNTIFISVITFIIGYLIGKHTGFKKSFRIHQSLLRGIKDTQQKIQEDLNSTQIKNAELEEKYQKLSEEARDLKVQQRRLHFGEAQLRMTPNFMSYDSPTKISQSNVFHLHQYQSSGKQDNEI